MLVGWSHQVSYAYHMPLFFFLSGMLFAKGRYPKFSEFVAKRAKRLLLPYLVYSLATWAVWAAFRYLRHDTVASYFAPLLQTFLGQGSGAFMVHNSALWFIPCLFVVELMYFFISKYKDWLNVLICFAACAVSYLLGHFYKDAWWNLLPFNFDAALIALPFYSLGNLLIKQYPHDELIGFTKANKLLSIVICVVLFAVLAVMALSFGEGSMGSSSYYCSGLIFVSRAFVGIVALLMLTLVMSNGRIIKEGFSSVYRYVLWCGQYSLDIMCLHIPVKGVIAIVIARLLHISVDAVSLEWLPASVVFILTMAIVSVMVVCINKWIRKSK